MKKIFVVLTLALAIGAGMVISTVASGKPAAMACGRPGDNC
jgi:hypothetical protein